MEQSVWKALLLFSYTVRTENDVLSSEAIYLKSQWVRNDSDSHEKIGDCERYNIVVCWRPQLLGDVDGQYDQDVTEDDHGIDDYE